MAKQKTTRKPKSATTTSTTTSIAKASALLVLAGLSSAVSQLTLSPVYGSIPASIWHSKALLTVVVSIVAAKTIFKKSLNPRWIPLVAFWSQPLQALLFRYSSSLGAAYGPVVTEALTLFPAVALSVYCAIDLLPPYLSPLAFVVLFVEKYAAALLPPLMGSSPLFTRSGLSLLVAALHAAVSPSLLLVLVLPALFHTVSLNPHFPSNFAVANDALAAHNYTLLERHESLTGYVSVLESRESQFRVLRCDHSLLGGHWMVTPARMETGQWHPEPIYSVFVMLEAVRLVKTLPADQERPDGAKRALNIGLGIGTAPAALVKHGINTTVVELDPVVHAMASKHFHLPANHTAVIADAVPWVADAAASQPGSFDYIVHDVFTGGAEPAALFTVEFLQGLKTLLRADDGVVAINYAGDLALPTTQLVLNTIHAVFPSCRIFRDSEKQQKPKTDVEGNPLPEDDTDFINMVLFCRPVAEPIRFRQAEERDYLNSIVRQRMMVPRADWEVPFTPDEKMGVLRKGGEDVLEKGHEKSAVEHWGIMRTVLPPSVWELW
ncbi:spermine/spermidine synthase family protein [Phyllosticta capitalensis]|uniref:Spermine/spermidine synthase family protein n=1 Tax=Phyllosticta capitalensis TaxID=121624 RepID=A0ABR1YJM9_9PEZI